MNILVTNDDGISAPGLAALAAAVADLGTVTVIAPDSPQSAAAHSITLHRSMKVEMHKVAEMDGLSVEGRPADCVRLAIRNLMPTRPDLVLSGINAGANVGINVFYSGTVAAAAEAAMCGIPAVAFSSAVASSRNDTTDYRTVAKYCRLVLDSLLRHNTLHVTPAGRGKLINVNVPLLYPELPLGVRVCHQSDADVMDSYVLKDDPDGIQRYHIGEEYEFLQPHAESDVALLSEHYITVTPLRVDMTAHEELAELNDCQQDDLPAL